LFLLAKLGFDNAQGHSAGNRLLAVADTQLALHVLQVKRHRTF
jgi:hypothetical protein